MISRFAIGAVMVLAILAGSSVFAQDDQGKAAYATCAACHLPDGVGIPSAFPPIRNRAAMIADLDGGREYLITVVSYGLMGTIEVGGVQFFGVMAGNSGSMSTADIAAALNYIVNVLVDNVDGVEEFTAEEVQSVQDSVKDKSPQTAGIQRQVLLEKNTDSWP